MSEDTEVENTDQFLEMSDEEFEALPDVMEEEAQELESDDGDTTEDEVQDSGDNEEDHTDEEEESEEGEEQEEEAVEESPEPEEDESDEEDSTEEATDGLSQFKRILEPFKANGKEMQIDNVDDALTLMQQGANYNKKMAALKPHLKIVKTLEKNELLDETKLNFLIDLSKKDPKAISKLINDSKLDPLELTEDEGDTYRPNQYTTTDAELELDQILGDIQDTPTYSRTIDILGNRWDDKSKKEVYTAPALIKMINDHVDRGVYDIIDTEVSKQKALGHLQGLSDIEAYKQVGDALQESGGFDVLHKTNQTTKQIVKKLSPKPNDTEDPNRVKKRKAAGAPRSAPTKGKQNLKDFNPLNMSDDEFEKLYSAQLQ